MATFRDLLSMLWVTTAPVEEPAASAIEELQEHPAQARIRLKRLEDGAAKVLYKLHRVYDFDVIPEQQRATPTQRMGDSIAEWMFRLPQYSQYLTSPEVLKEPLHNAMAKAVCDYAELFYVHRALRDCNIPNPQYGEYTKKSQDYLYEIYGNHITNAAEARLIAAGLSPLSAHHVNGGIIRQIIDIAEEEIDKNAYIAPAQGKPKSQVHAVRQVQYLHDFWQRREQDLRASFGSTTRH